MLDVFFCGLTVSAVVLVWQLLYFYYIITYYY